MYEQNAPCCPRGPGPPRRWRPLQTAAPAARTRCRAAAVSRAPGTPRASTCREKCINLPGEVHQPAGRSASTCREKCINLQGEVHQPAGKIASTCREKCINLQGKSHQPAGRSASTCRENRINLQGEVHQPAGRSASTSASTCREKCINLQGEVHQPAGRMNVDTGVHQGGSKGAVRVTPPLPSKIPLLIHESQQQNLNRKVPLNVSPGAHPDRKRKFSTTQPPQNLLFRAGDPGAHTHLWVSLHAHTHTHTHTHTQIHTHTHTHTHTHRSHSCGEPHTQGHIPMPTPIQVRSQQTTHPRSWSPQ